MGTAPFLHEFKKQASFFFKEKIKTARLALTDVTPAQLLTEEATDSNSLSPDSKTMEMISRAAFELGDYWRIVDILHKRLEKFDKNNWRISYKALIVLEHLLTHGPESVAEEFQMERDSIGDVGSFQHIDEKGFNWGLTVRKKSLRVLKLLEKGPLLKEERDQARKLTREIKGFGSFSMPHSSHAYSPEVVRCDSQPIGDNENQQLSSLRGNEFKVENEWDGNVDSNRPLLECNEHKTKGDYLEEDHPFHENDDGSSESLLNRI